MERMMGLFGLVAIVALSWALSNRKTSFPWRILCWGLGLQVGLALLILGVPALGIPGPLKVVFNALNDFVLEIMTFSEAGSRFVFGPMIDDEKMGGFIFAVRVLPSIIFFSALVAVLYHVGFLQIIVRSMAWVMLKTLRLSGAESLSTAANVFLGQTEAPLFVKPYIERMTRSELFCIMVGGMANTAGGVLIAYVGMLHSRMPDIAGHLITSSVLSAPAAILICKIMLPETEKPATAGELTLNEEKLDSNVIEAATRGASEGLSLALNVAAMLIAFIALAAMVNWGLGNVGNWIAFEKIAGAPLSLEWLLGKVCAPFAWLIGIPWSEAQSVGALLGQKVVFNEFVAYAKLSEMGSEFSDRSVIIISYALCGFANISSIGIQVGGIGVLAPSRRKDLAALGVRAVIAGNLASLSTAAIAGMIY